MELLQLHNPAWLVRVICRILIFFYYVHGLKNRRKGFLPFLIAGLISFVFDAQKYYQVLPYGLKLALGLCFHTALICTLKKSDFKNILFGAVVYEVIRDFCILVYDIEDGFLPGLTILGSWSTTARSYFFTILSLALNLLFVLIAVRLHVFRDKRRLPSGYMVLLLLPSALYFLVRNFQIYSMNTELIRDNTEYLSNFYLILLLLFISMLTISIMCNRIVSDQLRQEELANMKLLLARQRTDYLAKISATETLNQKYHDLKNCLLSLQAVEDSAPIIKAQLIQEVTDILRPLELDIDSGNEYFNIVLREKLALCREKQIRLTPYTDARCLSFMDGIDLCVLTGNLLDNAIEAVETLEPQKREIHVKIAAAGGFVILHFQNPCEHTPHFQENGLPKTGKTNSAEHGYGLRGVKSIVEKYQGTLAIRTENGEFLVDLLLPLGNR